MGAALAARGLHLQEGMKLHDHYIQKGKGDPDQIAVTQLNLKWLYANTNIRSEASEVLSCRLHACHA